MQNFRALGALPPNPPASGAGSFASRPPLASGGWVLRPQNPKTAPPLRISRYAPAWVHKITHWVIILCSGSQCRRYDEARGAVPHERLLVPPPFWFIQNAFLDHRVTTRQQAIMEKGIIIFKHDSRLKFSRLFAKLLATNCFTWMWPNKPSCFTDVSRKRDVCLQKRYRYFVSDYDPK